MEYLTDMPSDIMNGYGISKVLMTRRETIYIKHIMKNLFVYGQEEQLNNMLINLQFKSLFQYMEFLTNKLRSIYKITRKYTVNEVDDIVKVNRESICPTLELYKRLNPIVILDFDKTITNKKFHSFMTYLIEQNYRIIINSANPQEDVIQNYLIKNDLYSDKIKIYANKGKQKKIVRLKDIYNRNMMKPIFYIDDEEEYLNYGNLLFMHCYKYTSDGKIKSYTFFKK